MREIKFRAWDTANNCFQEIDNIIIARNNLPTSINSGKYQIQNNGQIVLSQYTGLKDKNGVEIYEGDIFAELEGDKERLEEYEFYGVVVFDEDMATFAVETSSGGWRYLSDYLIDDRYASYSTEVIGNIYENSNLIKD